MHVPAEPRAPWTAQDRAATPAGRLHFGGWPASYLPLSTPTGHETSVPARPPNRLGASVQGPLQLACSMAFAASAARWADASDLKKPAGSVTPVAWFGQ
jgi:hypothetical protein